MFIPSPPWEACEKKLDGTEMEVCEFCDSKFESEEDLFVHQTAHHGLLSIASDDQIFIGNEEVVTDDISEGKIEIIEHNTHKVRDIRGQQKRLYRIIAFVFTLQPKLLTKLT